MSSLKNTQDHRSDLKNMQSLQKLQQKLLFASFALDSTMQVVETLTNYWQRLYVSHACLEAEHMRRSMSSIAEDVRVYRKSTELLSEMLQSTCSLVSSLELNYQTCQLTDSSKKFSRNIEIRSIDKLQCLSEMSEKHFGSLHILTKEIRDQANDSGVLALRTQSDARSMKALSTIATVFLPASLVAVWRLSHLQVLMLIKRMQTIFSSNLVLLDQDKNITDVRGARFVIAPQFWIYILVTMALTATTIGTTRLLEKWLMRRS